MENCNKYHKTSIKSAMQEIERRNYLLPGIQRKFEWKAGQIVMLFDSIMQGYPINSFMFWKITDVNIKRDYTFYEFLKEYAERFKDENKKVTTILKENEDFYAVVDGQQRLTSLYIGMVGTYLYKKPNKQYREENLTAQHLYLNLAKELHNPSRPEQRYDFRFLDPTAAKNTENGDYWFKVGEVLRFNERGDVRQYLKEHDLNDNDFAAETLMTLYERISVDELINYCEINGTDQDKILNIFIRTNSGGTKLSLSNLLMSMIMDSWKYDMREEMEAVRKRVSKFGGKVPFRITNDFILKAMLVLSDGEVQFKIQNFNKMRDAGFEDRWPEIKESIIKTYEMLGQLGFNNDLLKAKNATIPIVYYVYKRGLSEEVFKPTYDKEDRARIASWLTKSLLKGIFSGHTDDTLKKIRDAMATEFENGMKEFPAEAIIELYRGNSERNYRFDDDELRKMLKEEYRSPRAGLVLMLLYPQVILEHGSAIAQDHMHPKTQFQNKAKLKEIEFSPEDEKFAVENYNTVLNLQLLEEYENKEKSKSSLAKWVEDEGVLRKDLLVNEDTSLAVEDFREFITAREENLLKELREILG